MSKTELIARHPVLSQRVGLDESACMSLDEWAQKHGWKISATDSGVSVPYEPQAMSDLFLVYTHFVFGNVAGTVYLGAVADRI